MKEALSKELLQAMAAFEGTVHIRRVPGSFSDRWFELCQGANLRHRSISPFRPKNLDALQAGDLLLLYYDHRDPVALKHAPRIVQLASAKGASVYPDLATCWHYDNKLAGQLLLEAVGAPVARGWSFFEREEAEAFLDSAAWPLVFKLRRGAGGSNVKLLRRGEEALPLIRRSFGRGFPAGESTSNVVSSQGRSMRTLAELSALLKRLPRGLIKHFRHRFLIPRERGYVYFQEFLPGNRFDTRVTIIGQRAFAFRRWNRPGDFRASGSGRLDYDQEAVDKRCIELAFDVQSRVGAQSLAFDFLMNEQGKPCIVEMSFMYAAFAIRACPGHYDRQLRWHGGSLGAEEAILEDRLHELLR